MFQEPVLLHFYNRKFSFFLAFITIFFSLSNSASITTLSLSSTTNHNFQLLSNNTYRLFFLRQYFIDLLNISHSSLIRSMIKVPELEQIKYRRRRQLFSTPVSTIHPTNCLIVNPHAIQTTFQWSHSIQYSSSVELIYHLNSKQSRISINISIKQSRTFSELLSIDTYLIYDSRRNYYSINLYDYLLKFDKNSFIIEIILYEQPCETSHGYIIISSSKSNQQIDSSQSQIPTECQLKTFEIKFEDLGLADIILRPKEYLFTYCDGSCLNPQSSIRSLLQTILHKKNPNIPQLKCVPTESTNDNFLLRQPDGTIEIYPIANAIVKQCACL